MMSDDKRRERDNNPWVQVARYSEIGFLIPAAVLVGYLLGLLADHLLHTHWIYLFGIIFGAISGCVSMSRRALSATAETDAEVADEERAKQGTHPHEPPPGPEVLP